MGLGGYDESDAKEPVEVVGPCRTKTTLRRIVHVFTISTVCGLEETPRMVMKKTRDLAKRTWNPLPVQKSIDYYSRTEIGSISPRISRKITLLGVPKQEIS